MGLSALRSSSSPASLLPSLFLRSASRRKQVVAGGEVEPHATSCATSSLPNFVWPHRSISVTSEPATMLEFSSFIFQVLSLDFAGRDGGRTWLPWVSPCFKFKFFRQFFEYYRELGFYSDLVSSSGKNSPNLSRRLPLRILQVKGKVWVRVSCLG